MNQIKKDAKQVFFNYSNQIYYYMVIQFFVNENNYLKLIYHVNHNPMKKFHKEKNK